VVGEETVLAAVAGARCLSRSMRGRGAPAWTNSNGCRVVRGGVPHPQISMRRQACLRIRVGRAL
ncbi:MAG: hypothetical protein KC492_10545, partial [Myxococcales bacterium]|nr:hypothetical protein [Myxococcales bacterium]